MVTQSDSDLVVLDTNVVSTLYKRDSHLREFYLDRLQDRQKLISFVTQYEVRWGIARSGWSERRKIDALNELESYEVVWGNSVVVQAAVELSLLCRQQPLSFQDLFIASTAYALGCPLATDDRRLATQLSSAGFGDVITRHGVGGDDAAS